MVKSELTGETQRPKFSKPVKVLVVVASYYKEISDDLISGATEELTALEPILMSLPSLERLNCRLLSAWPVDCANTTPMWRSVV
jgi:hypothetical protein